MAIQKINLGAPVTGVGGDKYRDAHTKINDNFTEVDSRLSGLQGGSTSQGVEITALKAKDASQDATIATKANTSDVNAKNGLQDNAIAALQTKDAEQDGAIALRALKTEVDSKNTLQDTAITALQDKDAAQDADISLRALKADVDSKNTLQDTAITAAQNKADAAIPETDKGAANGVATLDADGKVTSTQLPDVTPVAWGNITGNIADQLDLSELYYTKVEVNEQLGQFDTFLSYLYVKGAYYDTTTTAYPNVNIAADGALSRSTATFGTAAYKNFGEAAGNVMEVGAFGLGGSAAISNIADDIALKNILYNSGTRFYRNEYATGLSKPSSPSIFIRSFDTYSGISISYNGNGVLAYGGYNDSIVTYELWTDKNTPTSNLPVASIQAGIGAPKIAYKRFMETSPSSDTGTVEIPHGLNGDDILDVSVWIKRNTGEWSPVNFSSTGTYFTVAIKATTISVRNIAGNSLVNRPMKILITYEVS